MLALRRATTERLRCSRGCWEQQRRTKKIIFGPRRHNVPLPRTPWTVRGPPEGAPLPWYLRNVPPVREQVPELDAVTYEGKMYRVPWLAKPRLPQKWERGWHDPRHNLSLPVPERPSYKQRPCYIVHQRTRMLEGVKQALWLTKAKLIEGLPPQILSIMNDADAQLESQDEQVQNAISHARFWVTSEEDVEKQTYCPVLLEDLLHLCRLMMAKYPSLTKRMMAQEYRVAATWERESSLFQVRGLSGKILNAKDPLQPVASKEEIEDTENHVLETFYPITPTIDLQEVYAYETKNDTGFQEGYQYVHPHTIYVAQCDKEIGMQPEHLRAKMIMFAFGNALAKARKLYGEEPRILDNPIVVQGVATDGRCFQFIVFQLNTTDLDVSSGVKNLVWVDADQLLYEDARSRPEIKKQVVVVPAGIHGYQPDTFKKFLAFYLNGAM